MAHRNDRAAGRDRARTNDPIRPEPFPMLHHAGGELRELSENELTGLTGGAADYFLEFGAVDLRRSNLPR
jgi:hypothetical protein